MQISYLEECTCKACQVCHCLFDYNLVIIVRIV